MSSFNVFDKRTSKEEAGITLGIYIIGGLTTVYFADLGTVIAGINETTVIPEHIGEFIKTSGLALLSFIIGKKVGESNGNSTTGNNTVKTTS